MQIIFDCEDVIIRDVPPTPVAMIEHRGDRAAIPATRERFLAWSKAHGLSPETGRPSFMIFRSEREPANPADYSMDLCVGTDQAIAANDEGVKADVIPVDATRCCAIPAIPTISNPLHSISIANGFRQAAKKPATSHYFASVGYRLSPKRPHMKLSQSYFCR